MKYIWQSLIILSLLCGLDKNDSPLDALQKYDVDDKKIIQSHTYVSNLELSAAIKNAKEIAIANVKKDHIRQYISTYIIRLMLKSGIKDPRYVVAHNDDISNLILKTVQSISDLDFKTIHFARLDYGYNLNADQYDLEITIEILKRDILLHLYNNMWEYKNLVCRLYTNQCALFVKNANDIFKNI